MADRAESEAAACLAACPNSFSFKATVPISNVELCGDTLPLLRNAPLFMALLLAPPWPSCRILDMAEVVEAAEEGADRRGGSAPPSCERRVGVLVRLWSSHNHAQRQRDHPDSVKQHSAYNS